MIRCAVLMGSLALSACASAEVGRAHSEEEQKASIIRVAECLSRAAERFDDGVSPADTVARNIMPMCSAEIDASIETRGPFRSKRARAMSFEYARENSMMETATRIVLMRRAETRR